MTPPTLELRLPEPDMREMSLLVGREITLHRNQTGPGVVSTSLSSKRDMSHNDIPLSATIWLSDGDTFLAFRKNEHLPAKKARYLRSATLRLGSIATSEGSRQSRNCSESDIDRSGIISLTHDGQGYKGYRVLGSIDADIVSATKFQRGLELAVTGFEGDAWKDIKLELGETVYVKGNDYVNWKRQRDAEEDRKMEKMVATLLEEL